MMMANNIMYIRTYFFRSYISIRKNVIQLCLFAVAYSQGQGPSSAKMLVVPIRKLNPYKCLYGFHYEYEDQVCPTFLHTTICLYTVYEIKILSFVYAMYCCYTAYKRVQDWRNFLSNTETCPGSGEWWLHEGVLNLWSRGSGGG